MDFSRTLLAVGLVVSAGALFHTPECRAENWLREIVNFEPEKGVHEVEVVLGEALTLTSAFTPTSRNIFIAKAVASSDADNSDWEYTELSFDESDHALKRVSIEGSVQKGFNITLEFHDAVHLQTLPQYSTNRFSVIHASARTFRSLSNFSTRTNTKANPGFGPLALRFTLAGRFSVNAIPSALAINRRVYRHPLALDQVRVGFYPTKTAANVALRQLRGTYPDIDLVHVSAAEVVYAKHFNLYTDRVVGFYHPGDAENRFATNSPMPSLEIRSITPDTIDSEPEPEPAIIELRDEFDRSILDQAREAYLDRDFDSAIALYTKAGNQPQMRQQALEMLGVAREKNGQLAHAKNAYEQYLRSYPDDSASIRVRQRLQSLIGTDDAPVQLRSAGARGSSDWRLVGNLSQFYRRQSIEINHQDRSVPINAVFSDLNTIARRNGKNTVHEARIAVGHIQDFSDRDLRTFRVHRLYWESSFKKYGVGFTAGRQSRNNAGILGRFDGLSTSYRPRENLQVNVTGGYLVNSTFDSLSTDRPFYGINAELEFLDGRLEVSPFYVEQKRDDVLDRRAVGAQTFYYSDRFTAGGLVDYDIYHQALNNLYLTGSYNVNQEWRLTGAYDLRRSPYLTTSNALIGQAYDDLSELERSLIDVELEDIAEDRTATSHVVRVGIDGNLNNTWSMSMDASWSDFSATDASVGVNALETHNDYYITTQLRATDLITDNSYSAVQLRYMASDTAKTSMVYLTNRFKWNDWLVYPRMIASQRTYKTSDQEQIQLRPSLRFDYRGFKRFRLEFEMGYEWTTRETAARDIDILGYYFNIGYRTLF
jgi:hypothetical protein